MKTAGMLIVAAALLLLGCTGYQPAAPAPTSTAAPATITGQPTTTTTGTATSGAKEFTVTAEKWKFTPAEIRVKKGDRVRLKITSVDVTHGFSLPDFNVNANIEPGRETVVEFTVDKEGSFTFFCSVFCGEGHGGMKGQLVVEP